MKRQGIFEFSEFTLDPRTRTLKRQGEAVTLTRRGFDVLLYLIQNSGRIVPRDELVKNVWPDTFVDENSLARSISALRQALEEKPGDNNFIVTVPGRGYQFVSEVRNGEELEIQAMAPEGAATGVGASGVILERETIRTSITQQDQPLPGLPAPRRSRAKITIAVLLLAGLCGGGYLLHRRLAPRLTAKDTVVLADFANTTGDPVFDDTLRQGLSTELEQSPFLNLLSDQRISHTLALMTQPRDARLTAELAREVCQRTGSAAVLNGTIAQIGTRYLLTLKAANCFTGETLASTEAEAHDKNQVLDALGTIGSDIRRKLGESLATVEKYDVTLREATTPSVEALRAFSLGERFLYQGDNASVPYFQGALELDPNFAMAYMQLGIAWMWEGEPGRARESFAKAFSLREHTSEREKLQIDSAYYGSVTGELDKAIQSLQQVIEIYKHTPAYHGLIIYYSKTGQYEKSADGARILLAHDVDRNFAFYRLAMDEIALQNFNEAQKVIGQAQASGVDDSVHGLLYLLAFLQSDPAGMAEQQTWFAGHGGEIYAFELAANTEAYGGHLAKARELTRSAVDAAMQDKNMGSAAANAANGALRDAAYGDLAEARREAAEAAKLAPGDPSVMTQAALAFAVSREKARAENLVQELNKHFPLNTQVQLLSIPAIEAQLQLGGGQADAALKTLHGGLSIEYGDTQPGSANLSCLYATYIRAEVYLAAGRGAEAAGEFTKIIDHSGIVGNCWTGALAHLGVARANALQSRTSQGADADAARVRALAAYKDFLTLWKDADPDIPILKQAKTEYAKLQ